MEFRKVTPDSINYLKTASVAEQARLYIKLTKQHRTAVQNVWFNQECKRMNIVPNYVHIRCNNKSRSAQIAVKKAQKIWLNEEARNWFSIRDNLKVHLKVLYSELSYKLHNIEFDILDQKARHFASEIAHKMYIRQSDKLRRLSSPNVDFSSRNRNSEPTACHKFHPRVKNLSNVEFSGNELKLLNKGLKYNLQSKITQKSLENLAVDSEVAIVLSNNDIETKTLVAREIRNASPYGNSIFRSDTLLLRSIQQKIHDNDLVVSRADKGNCIVILNRNDYKQKVLDIVQSNEFSILRKDPTPNFHKELKNVVKNSSYVFETDQQKSIVVPMNPQSPILYGLPKLHKDNIPVRPVVSYLDAPTYKLARKLNSVVKEKSSFKPACCLKNSLDLIDKIKDIHLPNNSILLSLDVDSLFTNVPYMETLGILRDLFEKQLLHPAEVDELIDMITICMKQNYFVFDGQYYLQSDGLAMGSPLSPLMADVFMDHFESQHIVGNADILYYFRYVDDLILCWTGSMSQLDDFINDLNNKHPKIKFKKELEQNNSLNFLDLTISKVNNKHQFQIFRKPTHTDIVIPACSTHPWQHKAAAFHCYIHRLLSVPLSEDNYNLELNNIYHLAVTNGYKKSLIDSIIRKKQAGIANSLLYAAQPIQPIEKYKASITYIGKVSDKICKILKSNGVNVAFKTNNTLQSMLFNGKDKVEKGKKSGVYKLACGDCNKVYVGQTGRSFNTRYKEHVACFRHNHPDKSNFAKHLLENDHNLRDGNSFDILHVCGKGLRLSVLEQMEIVRYKNRGIIINEQLDVTASPLLRIFPSRSMTHANEGEGRDAC